MYVSRQRHRRLNTQWILSVSLWALKIAVTLSLLRVTANYQWLRELSDVHTKVGATHTPVLQVPCSKPGLTARTSRQGNLPHFFPKPFCSCLVPPKARQTAYTSLTKGTTQNCQSSGDNARAGITRVLCTQTKV